jgi:uncharacterized protein YvpB
MQRWRCFALAVIALAGLTGAVGGARPAAASDVKNVDVYMQLASATPAPGCWVDVTVELRSGGYALPGTEVLLGVVIDGELVAADRSSTGESGIAYLGVDTSAGWDGADGWVDVNVNGTYVGGTSLPISSGGSCSGDARLWTASHDVWLPSPSEVASGVSAEAASDSSGDSGGASIWVPTYYQQRNLSCEYASLTIATSAWGNGISEFSFDNLAGWSANPHWGYRGDINGTWGNTTDYGIYAEALVWPLSQFGFGGEAFYGQGDSSALTSRLDAGLPTLVWLGLWGDQTFLEYTEDGTAYKLTAGLHVVVAYEYDGNGVWISDPATGSYRFYDWGTFMWMWNVLDGMALSVYPL